MVKNKAVDVLKTFSKEEFRAFELFIRSPYFNSNKALINLYGLMRKYLDDTCTGKITEEFLYRKLYPEKGYNYRIMKNLVSGMFCMIEKFFALHPAAGISEDARKVIEFEEGLRRLDNYINRSLEKFFYAEYKQLEDHLGSNALSAEYYLNKSRLVGKLHEFYTRKSYYKGAAETLYPRSIYNTCYSISALKHDVAGMDYLKNQLNYSPEVNITNAFYDNFNNEGFLKSVKNINKQYYDHVSLEIMLMKLYKEPGNFENYSALKKFILESLGNYSNTEKWHLSSALINFLLNAYIGGSTESLTEIAAIRKIQLSVVKFNAEGMGPMQAGTFRNIAEVFVLLGKKDYSIEFIKKFSKELEADAKLSNYSYAMALVEESKGNNERVLELIRSVEFTDYQTKFSARMLAIVAFYNLGFIEEGLSAIDAIKHFIKDTGEFSKAAKKNLGERVAMMEKLFKIKANPEKYTLADVNTLEETAMVYLAARKEWFLARTAELRKLVAG